MKKPEEILGSLSPLDQKVVKTLLNVERAKMHILDLKAGSREDKKLVEQVVTLLRQEISHED